MHKKFVGRSTNGISATWKPVGDVSLASSSRTPREYNTSRALTIDSGGGDAGQSKPRMLSMPKDFNCAFNNLTISHMKLDKIQNHKS